MNSVQPKSLGDAYPALCNFLRLTSLTLAAPQLALTVQVGDDWRHGGVMNYGQIPVAILREVLASQPVAGAVSHSTQLTLSTYLRSQPSPQAEPNRVLAGHLKGTDARYQLTFYVPGLALDQLSEVQIKTLQYLSQQLMLCITLAQPVPTALRPSSAPPAAALPVANLPVADLPVADLPVADLPVIAPSRVDFLSRVVSLSSQGATGDRLHQGHPRLADLVAQLQSCLSYKQLGQLLATYLPYFFPHQSGRLVL